MKWSIDWGVAIVQKSPVGAPLGPTARLLGSRSSLGLPAGLSCVSVPAGDNRRLVECKKLDKQVKRFRR